VAIRPAASSGVNGSAIELASVVYRGKRVLRRAHVPILNVRYDNDACGPYRDWQNEEGKLDATGDDVRDPPGRHAGKSISSRPRPRQLRRDRHLRRREVVLVCELQAGWYRYVSYWRLHADGTIRPRFGFGAVHPRACATSTIPASGTFTFNVVNATDNDVHEFNDPPLGGSSKWHALPN
jgi:hypothetical protein